ncbi:hypothetical protein [Streptomyces sp. DSM 41634]|uniref:hypothetical protein n=1 Tax=Streptomyces sp. DSM 41634 TaxID=3448656 RepID=UPI002887DDD6|nr:hypothetical protein [Streptomyces sp. DSM 41633]
MASCCETDDCAGCACCRPYAPRFSRPAARPAPARTADHPCKPVPAARPEVRQAALASIRANLQQRREEAARARNYRTR